MDGDKRVAPRHVEMCQKMLDEDTVIIRKLREENVRLKGELAAAMVSHVDIERYKETVARLSAKIVELKKQVK